MPDRSSGLGPEFVHVRHHMGVSWTRAGGKPPLPTLHQIESPDINSPGSQSVGLHPRVMADRLASQLIPETLEHHWIVGRPFDTIQSLPPAFHL